ncbi:MAG: 16S rRNA (cytosine1402-N4)-methyltransferase [Bacteroidia bacterium]|jgi:16S rRNA (cytosine1402-N4)-methyltransferase
MMYNPMETSNYHIPVMLPECMEGLQIKPTGMYVDVTFGGGSHSKAIVNQLTTGKLVAFDQDDDAVANVFEDDRLIFVNHNFQYFKNFLKFCEIEKVDGILADLGVSSHQINEGSRGFSFRQDAPLDMRMNQEQTQSAFDVVNTYSNEQLSFVFKTYGEVRVAWKLANEIVAVRQHTPIKSTGQLAEIALPFIPVKVQNKTLAQIFQAIRIEVNGELETLKKLLTDSTEMLAPGGRLVVMSYHSLEDRLVKNFMNSGNLSGDVETDIKGVPSTPFKVLTRKPITPGDEELERNPRSRSAKLRIAEKL